MGNCIRTERRKYAVQDLCRVSRDGDLAAVQIMLAKDPWMARKGGVYGGRPLNIAIEGKGNPEVVRSLLDAGADPNVGLPLHAAVEKGREAAAELLLARGARVDAKDPSGQTALHLAVCWGRENLVRLLLKTGADVNARDNNGRTPFLCTAISQSTEIAEMLIKQGADVNARDKSGASAADLAGGGDYVAWLRQHGASVR